MKVVGIGGEEGLPEGKLGLWESILREAATEKKAPDATLLLLGRPGVGKRTLVQALLAYACPAAAAADAAADAMPEGSKGHSRAVGLDCAYFGARDPEENEEAGAPDYVCPSAFSVLILEDARHEKLLRSRLNLNADGLRHCAAMVCLDLKEPWTMMEDLRCWLELLQRLTSELQQQLELGEQDELRARVADAVASHREAGDAGAGAEGATLACNLGIPLIVAVTRADGASALETQKTVGWSETIEAYLRSECLGYGAAIVYTMVQAKNNRNVDVLYDYLMHRLYDYPLKQKARTPSRDALFLPGGWDSQVKVDQISAALSGGLERSFESIVVPLEQTKAEVPFADECEDMQAFLKRSAVLLQKLGGASAKAAVGADGSASARQRTSALDLASVGSGRRTSERPDGPGVPGAGSTPAATDNSSLANFFQTLLTRGQAGAAQGARPSSAAAAAAPAPAQAPATVPAAAPTTGPAATGAAAAAPTPAVTLQVPDTTA